MFQIYLILMETWETLENIKNIQNTGNLENNGKPEILKSRKHSKIQK